MPGSSLAEAIHLAAILSQSGISQIANIELHIERKKNSGKNLMFMLHVLAPLLPSLHRSFSGQDVWSRLEATWEKTQEGGGKNLRTKLTDELKQKMFISCIFSTSSLIPISSEKPQQKPARPQSHRILHYNLFEMPIRYGIEFAVNRQPEIKNNNRRAVRKRAKLCECRNTI